MENTIYLVTAFLFAVGIYIAIQIFRVRKAARSKHHEIGWVVGQLDRSLEQLDSLDEQVVIAGLQALSVLNDEGIRQRALRRVSELAHNNNPRIAREANSVLSRVYSLPVNEQLWKSENEYLRTIHPG